MLSTSSALEANTRGGLGDGSAMDMSLGVPEIVRGMFCKLVRFVSYGALERQDHVTTGNNDTISPRESASKCGTFSTGSVLDAFGGRHLRNTYLIEGRWAW